MSDCKYFYKILVVGDTKVGKTSLMGLIDHHDKHDKDVGMEPFSYSQTCGDTSICLQLWDVSGKKCFKGMRRVFYPGTLGVILIYDITNRDSFENLPNWLEEIRIDCNPLTFVLFGNKKDLEDKRKVSFKKGKIFAEENFLQFFETSNKQVNELEQVLNSFGFNILNKIESK